MEQIENVKKDRYCLHGIVRYCTENVLILEHVWRPNGWPSLEYGKCVRTQQQKKNEQSLLVVGWQQRAKETICRRAHPLLRQNALCLMRISFIFFLSGEYKLYTNDFQFFSANMMFHLPISIERSEWQQQTSTQCRKYVSWQGSIYWINQRVPSLAFLFNVIEPK